MILKRQIVTGGIGLGIAVAVGFFAVSAGAKKRDAAQLRLDEKLGQHTSARPVELETVTAEKRNEARSFPGVIRASEVTAMSFRVGGPLVELNVVLGEPVRKGDVLMQIDARDYEDQILALEAQQAGAAALQRNAHQDFTRISALFEDQVVPQSDYDRARSGKERADANVKLIEAQLQIARHALVDTTLLAPYDGTVTEQRVENHEMIAPGQVVLKYHDIAKLEIAVNVPENEILHHPSKKGTSVRVSFPGAPGKSYVAELKEWGTRADPVTRTYTVIFEMNAPTDLKVLPGMTAKVTVAEAADRAMVLTVPVSALRAAADGGDRVWIFDEATDSIAERAVVTAGLVGGSRMAIERGLVAGERVVVSGSRLIHSNLALKTASSK